MHLPRLLRNTGFGFALLFTGVFVVAVAIIGWITEATITAALEQRARERVDVEAASLTADRLEHGSSALRSSVEARTADPRQRLYYAIIDTQGRAIDGSLFLAPFVDSGTTGAHPRKGANAEDASDALIVATQRMPDGDRLIVADPLDSVEEIEDVFSEAFATALAVAVVLGLGAGTMFTRSLLRRVDSVTRTAEAIIAGHFKRRVPLAGSGDHLDRLASTFNAMLDRITGLMESVQQVSNDIAHDLRTPLSRLRQRLEREARRAQATGECSEAIEQSLADADTLLQTFEAMLRIAQVEAGGPRAAFREVDFSEVLRTVTDAYQPVAEDAGRSMHTDIAGGLAIPGDRELLAQLFVNLVENALHHSPTGTAIDVRAALDSGGVVAEIADHGPGIPPEEREAVFRRFYRLERSRTSPGQGLGLSLVRAIADLHDAQVELFDNGPGLRVRVRFGGHGIPARPKASQNPPSRHRFSRTRTR